MKRSELTKLLTFMSDIYPNFDFPKDTADNTDRFRESWYKYLGNYSFETAQKALDKISSDEAKKWPPSAPQLRAKAQKVVEKREREIKQERMRQMIEEGKHPELNPSDLEQ